MLIVENHRFLCPPPTAIMIGNSWWSGVPRRNEEPKPCPPRVIVSISGEPVPQEGTIEWTSSNGKAFDVNDAPAGTTYIGRCVGKQLFISDVDEKKKKVEALVKIMAPSADDETERVIGVFPSRPIKVISKPSKKRQSAKNLERGSYLSPFSKLFLGSQPYFQFASTMVPLSLYSTACAHRPSLQNISASLVPDLLSRVQMGLQ